MRKFEKVSFDEFRKYYGDNRKLYESYSMPKRNTIASAGYDFYAINNFTLKPGETIIIPSGIKVCMNDDEALMLFVRSSMGFKYNVRLCNQVGIIDSDYYNNPDNEGHMFIKLQNEGEETYVVKKGDRYTQGVFIKYLTVDNDELANSSPMQLKKKRKSGLGSTDRKDD